MVLSFNRAQPFIFLSLVWPLSLLCLSGQQPVCLSMCAQARPFFLFVVLQPWSSTKETRGGGQTTRNSLSTVVYGCTHGHLATSRAMLASCSQMAKGVQLNEFDWSHPKKKKARVRLMKPKNHWYVSEIRAGKEKTFLCLHLVRWSSTRVSPEHLFQRFPPLINPLTHSLSFPRSCSQFFTDPISGQDRLFPSLYPDVGCGVDPPFLFVPSFHSYLFLQVHSVNGLMSHLFLYPLQSVSICPLPLGVNPSFGCLSLFLFLSLSSDNLFWLQGKGGWKQGGGWEEAKKYSCYPPFLYYNQMGQCTKGSLRSLKLTLRRVFICTLFIQKSI